MDPFSVDGLPQVNSNSSPKPNLFSDVSFSVSGRINTKLLKLLENGGAKQRSYAGVGITHFFAGPDADEIKVEEVKDIFETPIVSPRWITYSVLLQKVLPIHGFNGEFGQLFSSVTATVSGARDADLKHIWTILTYHGGTFSKVLTDKCTHLLTNNCTGSKFKMAQQRGIRIVCYDWLSESLAKGKLEDTKMYHPSLLVQSVKVLPLEVQAQAKTPAVPREDPPTLPPSTPTPPLPTTLPPTAILALPTPTPTPTPPPPPPSTPTTAPRLPQQAGVRPATSTATHWTQQQQAEIIRQIQNDPLIKQQWGQMDHQQRTLLIQKLAQRNREDHLRREMMIRQQQMNLQNPSQTQRPQLNVNLSPAGSQITATVPQSTPTMHQIGRITMTSELRARFATMSRLGQKKTLMRLAEEQGVTSPTNADVRHHLQQYTQQQQQQQQQQYVQLPETSQHQILPPHQQNSQLSGLLPPRPRGISINQMFERIPVVRNTLPEMGNHEQLVFKSQAQTVSESAQPPQPLNVDMKPNIEGLIKIEPNTFDQPSQERNLNHSVQVPNQPSQFQAQSPSEGEAATKQLQSAASLPQQGDNLFTPNQRITPPQHQPPASPQLPPTFFQQGQGQDSHLQNQPSTQLDGNDTVRVQQVFSPHFTQQNQSRTNVRHIYVHQGGEPRLQKPQLILQSNSPLEPNLPGQEATKVSPLGTPPGTLSTPVGAAPQWITSPIRQQRDPNSPISQMQLNRPVTPEASSAATQQWSSQIRQQAQPHGSVIYTTSQRNLPFVQVVNSRTKTALANLLSNRLQGGTGPETTMVPTTMVPVSSPQQGQCPTTSPIHHSVSPPSTSGTGQNLMDRRNLTNINTNGKPHQLSNTPPQVSPQPAIPLVPARAQFYGHDPNIKLPPDGFLLGCIFWAAQPLDSEIWENCVERYGGEVEKTYCSRLTHVLCVTQKFPEFHQAIREGKRLVTLHWLSDICLRKCVVSPFYALHLPVPLSSNEKPLEGEYIGVTGFIGEDRLRIRIMCSILGATLTPYFSKANMALVAHKPEGEKYQRAREWKKPVVNVQFLNELMFGQTVSMQMIHSPKYQHFNLEQPFRCDIGLVSQLMGAWKVPIRVSGDSFEKYRFRKRPGDNGEESPHAKRKRLFNEDKEFLESIFNPLDGPIEPPTIPPVIAITGFVRAYKEKMKENIEYLGGKVTEDEFSATYLITKPTIRTKKFFVALSRASFIVTTSWIYDSLVQRKFVDASNYWLEDTQFETNFERKIKDIVQSPNREKLFTGITFYLSPCIEPDIETTRAVIESAGGQVDTNQNSIKTVKALASASKKYVIVTCSDDKHLFRRTSSEKEVKYILHYPEAVFTAIFNQSNPFA